MKYKQEIKLKIAQLIQIKLAKKSNDISSSLVISCKNDSVLYVYFEEIEVDRLVLSKVDDKDLLEWLEVL